MEEPITKEAFKELMNAVFVEGRKKVVTTEVKEGIVFGYDKDGKFIMCLGKETLDKMFPS
jgi:hypothetical protein